MVRLFKRYNLRKSTILDGVWQFKTDPNNEGLAQKWYERFPEDNMGVVIPSCWNNELGLYDYEGQAWYKTIFSTTQKNFNLHFYGVTGLCTVYVDGKQVGTHYGGFTGFEVLIKDLEVGQHTLVLAVDNTHDDLNTIPLAKVDWFHYGGITRSVELMDLGNVWIKDYRIDYKLSNALNNANLSFDVTLEGLKDEAYKRNLCIYIDENKVYSTTVEGKGLLKLNVRDITLENLKLWDVDSPNLYNIRFEIEDDDIIDRIGFRDIKVENNKILLNGKEIYLKGVNRHEDHPEWGFSVPLKLMKKDIDIIKNLGCNTIRGSHYPNAPIFLDYLDQEGILFWEEIPMWGFPEAPLKNPLIMERGLLMHEEMVKRDLHHPSIIMWGMHNEIDTRTDAAYAITKAFSEKVRSLDTSRPLTFATMFPLEDICLPLVDIISINKYFGWYHDNLEGWATFLSDFKVKLTKEKLEHMAVIISEFGAGAIYGDRTFEGPKWTENYQDKYLEYTLNLFHKDPIISGTYIWQFCDIRSSKELELGRPRSFNNKGILNEYRKPKMAYWTVQKIYKSIK